MLSAGCGGRDSPAPGGSTRDGSLDRAVPSGDGRIASSGDGRAPQEDLSLGTGLRLLRDGDFGGAEPHLIAALESAPEDRRVLQGLGAIYMRSDRLRQAEEVLRRALEVEPSAIGARIGLAEVLRKGGRYDEALEALEEVLRRDPDNLKAVFDRAFVLRRLGRVEEAATAARMAIGRQEGNAEAHYILGLCLEQQGKLAEAAGELSRAVELRREHLGALSHLATIEMRRGRPVEAEAFREAHRRALARRRVDDRVREHRRDGIAALNRQDYPTALREFEAVAREDPSDPQVYVYIGSAHIALGDLVAGRAALDRCLRLEPRNERALMELGRLHALAKRLDEAVEALRQSIAVNPDFAEPHYFLAGVYMARGEPDLYRQEMQRYQALKARSQGDAMDLIGGPMGEAR